MGTLSALGATSAERSRWASANHTPATTSAAPINSRAPNASCATRAPTTTAITGMTSAESPTIHVASRCKSQ